MNLKTFVLFLLIFVICSTVYFKSIWWISCLSYFLDHFDFIWLGSMRDKEPHFLGVWTVAPKTLRIHDFIRTSLKFDFITKYLSMTWITQKNRVRYGWGGKVGEIHSTDKQRMRANRREGSSKFLKIPGTYFLNGPISIFNIINKRKLSERATHASRLNLLVNLGSQCIKLSTFLES